ncbi:unnamed protein product [Adineta steineri]|uniref:Polycystin cation channel PKD1/PKD2 domain-containing protein n=1 Tax=Adineta steineri TaxID=433720 RepID=A0A814YX21_9BILA|nr:unnamed protein product [Adineta steineri]
MLFEMLLMNFDAEEIMGAGAFLGPFCFTLFIIVVVFICLSMFMAIIIDSFHLARDNQPEDPAIISFMMKIFLHWTGLNKLNKLEMEEERDSQIRSQYVDPIEHFPNKIDQLLEALDRIYRDQKAEMLRLNKAGV